MAPAHSALLGTIFGHAVLRRSVDEIFGPEADGGHTGFVAAVVGSDQGSPVVGSDQGSPVVGSDPGPYPNLMAVAPAWMTMERDAPFIFALDRLLDGIAALADG